MKESGVTMKYIIAALFISITLPYSMFAYSRAGTDLSNMPDDIRAMISKEKVRMQDAQKVGDDAANNNGGSDSSSSSSRKNNTLIDGGLTTGCDINIGNSDSKKSVNSKPTTVIITGPVIQMPNKGCK